jgi:hypothetical protein
MHTIEMYTNKMKSGLFGLLLVSAIATSFDAQGMKAAIVDVGTSLSQAARKPNNKWNFKCSLLLGTANGLVSQYIAGGASKTALPFFYAVIKNTRFAPWAIQKGWKGFATMATVGGWANEIVFSAWDIAFLAGLRLTCDYLHHEHNGFMGTVIGDLAGNIRKTLWTFNRDGHMVADVVAANSPKNPDIFNAEKTTKIDLYEQGFNLVSRATLFAILTGAGALTNPATFAFTMGVPVVGKLAYASYTWYAKN